VRPRGRASFLPGQEIDGPDLPEGTELAVFGPAGRLVGVGRMAQARRLAPLRLMSPSAANGNRLILLEFVSGSALKSLFSAKRKFSRELES
jgi:hypothetical protein